MNVISRRPLIEFWGKHPKAEAPLRAWYALVEKSDWANTSDIRATFNSADFVGDNRVVFNIGGNNYRIVAHIAYKHKRVLIKFVGTHSEYDKIKVETV